MDYIRNASQLATCTQLGFGNENHSDGKYFIILAILRVSAKVRTSKHFHMFSNMDHTHITDYIQNYHSTSHLVNS